MRSGQSKFTDQSSDVIRHVVNRGGLVRRLATPRAAIVYQKKVVVLSEHRTNRGPMTKVAPVSGKENQRSSAPLQLIIETNTIHNVGGHGK